MIDIQWGDFVFYVEGSAATVVVAIPLLAIMQIPIVARAVKAVVSLLRRRHSKVDSIFDLVQRAEKSLR